MSNCPMLHASHSHEVLILPVSPRHNPVAGPCPAGCATNASEAYFKFEKKTLKFAAAAVICLAQSSRAPGQLTSVRATELPFLYTGTL